MPNRRPVVLDVGVKVTCAAAVDATNTDGSTGSGGHAPDTSVRVAVRQSMSAVHVMLVHFMYLTVPFPTLQALLRCTCC